MRDTLETELGRYIYDYGPLLKTYISKEVLMDIANSFCIRNNATLIRYEQMVYGVHIITIKIQDESLEIYRDWALSYEDHGYSPPLLDVVGSDTT